MTEIINALNWVDVVYVIALLRGAYIGYKSGLLVELLRFFLLFVALFCAYYTGEYLGNELLLRFDFVSPELAHAFAGIGTFILIAIALKLLTVILLKVVKELEGKLFSFLGIVVALIRTSFVLSVIFMAIDYIGFAAVYEDIATNSYVGSRLMMIGPIAFEYLESIVPPLG